MNKPLSLLTILLISGITFAHAIDNPNTKMVVLKNGSTFRLLYKGAEQSDVKVLILNDENQIVFAEKIKNTDGFARPYNFSNLPEGHYSIQIKDNAGVRTETVNHHIIKAEKTMHLLRLDGTDPRLRSAQPFDDFEANHSSASAFVVTPNAFGAPRAPSPSLGSGRLHTRPRRKEALT